MSINLIEGKYQREEGITAAEPGVCDMGLL